MGRKSLPDNVKKARGTLQKCRVVDSSGIEMLDSIKAPSWLNVSAKKIFRQKALSLIAYRVLSELDIDQLAIYAVKMTEIQDLQKDIEDNGYTMKVKDKKGNEIVIINPSVKMLKDDIKIVLAIGANFGFSPADRRVLAGSAAKEKDDEFTDFEEVL